MNVAELFIKRPITTTLIMLGISVFGAMAYQLLPVSDLPTVDFPTIQVQASLPGASPETMASSVALPLEKQFATIAGLDSLNSTSAQGSTNITLQFDLNRNIDAAAQDVQAMIARAARQLPPQMPSAPSYQKVNPGDQPVIFLSLRSATMPLSNVNEYAETIAQRISMVNGVAQVQVFGAAKYAVRVDLDPRKLVVARHRHRRGRRRRFRGRTSTCRRERCTARTAPITVSGQRPAAASRGVRANGRLLIGTAIRCGSTRWRASTTASRRTRSANWYKGARTIYLAILKQPGTNVVAVVDAIKSLLPTFSDQLPPSVITRRAHRPVAVRSAIGPRREDDAVAHLRVWSWP